MRKIKNWALTAFFIIGGIADLGFDILTEVTDSFDLDRKYISILRVIIIVIAFLKLKLETPTKNPEKLQEIANDAYYKQLNK